MLEVGGPKDCSRNGEGLMCIYVHACACMYAWRPEVNVSCLPLLFLISWDKVCLNLELSGQQTPGSFIVFASLVLRLHMCIPVLVCWLFFLHLMPESWTHALMFAQPSKPSHLCRNKFFLNFLLCCMLANLCHFPLKQSSCRFGKRLGLAEAGKPIMLKVAKQHSCTQCFLTIVLKK